MPKRLAAVTFCVAAYLISFATLATAGTDQLTLWHTAFVNEWSGRQEVVSFFERNTKLPVSRDYGPALYRDVAQQFFLQAKTGVPDVLEGVLEQMLTYAEAGLIAPITDLFETYEDRQYYAPNAIEALKIGGQLYGVPYNVNVRLLLYRKSIFEKYNLKVPTNWDELVETAVWISKNVPGMQGFMLTTKSEEVRAFQEFMSFYFQLNKHMFNVEGDQVTVAATPQQLTQVLELYRRLFTEGAIDPNERGADWKALDYGYTAGKYAMVTVGPWIWSHRYEDPERAKVLDDTGIAPLPVARNGSPGTYMEVKPIMINRYTRDRARAWELLKEVTSREFQLKIDLLQGVLSPRSDVMAAPEMRDNWWLSGFGKYMHTGVALDPVNWARPQTAIINAIQQVIYGQMTPQQAGTWLYDQLRRIAATL